jgi:hypothetical protein
VKNKVVPLEEIMVHIMLCEEVGDCHCQKQNIIGIELWFMFYIENVTHTKNLCYTILKTKNT